MAFDVPVPRSYQAIEGDIIDTLRSRYGIDRLKIGGGILTMIEAAAQSDLRCTQDIFNLLDLADFNRLNGSALEYKAFEDGVTRLGALASQGSVTFSDPRFSRISSRVYSGLPPPAAGTNIIAVANASSWPASGNIYIGRGTKNAEGPLAYSSVSDQGGYWQVNLSAVTTRFHALNEDVVVGQGGIRQITAGTIVGVGQTGLASSIDFRTTALAQILDGEVSVAGVPVVCQAAGSQGNVPAGAINVVRSTVFPQAQVTNTTGFTTGRDQESDDQLKDRLRATRASKARGTATAILLAVKGVTSTSEQKSVLSASLVRPAGAAATLYIDDGSGYEETDLGIPYEVLVDEASGGEQFFALSGARPIAKAYLDSTLTAPFKLVDGATLGVIVGGTTYLHSFDADDFIAINAATAAEVVSSINANPDIQFSARTTNNRTGVAIFARVDVGEDLEVVDVSADDLVDANDYLGFSTTPTYTLRLYKNDELLYKDGRLAIIESKQQSDWGTLSGSVTLKLAVDGTAMTTYTITDSDFVNAETDYTTVAETNSVQSWADVINYKVPGVTAEDGGDFLRLKSNLGALARASLELDSTGDINAEMFDTEDLDVVFAGRPSDYTLDRQTGEIQLATKLVAGDSLTAGSDFTNADLLGDEYTDGEITLDATARLWVAVDVALTEVELDIDASTTIATSNSSQVVTYTSSPAAFTNVQTGDYLIIYDPALNAHGSFRVIERTSTSVVKLNRTATANESATALTISGMRCYRPPSAAQTQGQVQCLRVRQGTRALSDIVDDINDQLLGGYAEVYRNTKIRLYSSDLNSGSIQVLAVDTEGAKIGFDVAAQADATVSHVGFLQAQSEVGTPWFTEAGSLFTVTNPGDLGANLQYTGPVLDVPTFTLEQPIQETPGLFMYGLRKRDENGYGNIVDEYYPVANVLSIATGSHTAGTSTKLAFRKKDPDLSEVTSITCAGTTATVTMSAPHYVAVGDLMQVYPISTADANFPAGIYVVTAVPSATTWRYTNTSYTGTAAQDYGVQHYDGVTLSSTQKDWVAPVRPYAIAAGETLNVVLDNDQQNQTYGVPMSRSVSLASYSAHTPIVFTDEDNGGDDPSVAFGDANPNFFQDFVLHSQANALSHGNDSAKALSWIFQRLGPEGNRVRLEYINPSEPDAALSHSLQFREEWTDKSLTNPVAMIQVKLASGAEIDCGITDTARFTWAVSATADAAVEDVTVTYFRNTVNSGSLVRNSGVTTATCTAAHYLTTGDLVYLTSSDPNFPAGTKLVTVTGGTTFTYPDGDANATSASATYFSTAPTDPDFSALSGYTGCSGVAALRSLSTGSFTSGDYGINAQTASSFSFFTPTGAFETITTPIEVGDVSNMVFFQKNAAANTAAAIRTYANASMNDLVSVNLVGAGTGSITVATFEEYALDIDGTNTPNTTTTPLSTGTTVPFWNFGGGISWVQESALSESVDSTLTLKAVTPAPEDYFEADAEHALVPVSAETLTRWLNSPAVSGIYNSVQASVAGTQRTLQLQTRSMGSEASILIQSSSPNQVDVPVVSVSTVDSAFGLVQVSAATEGVQGQQWIRLSNSLPTPKTVTLSTSDTIEFAADGTVSFSVPVWDKTTEAVSGDIEIHRIDDYTLFIFPASMVLGFDPTGYWFQLDAGASTANDGIYRVVAYRDTNGTTAGVRCYLWCDHSSGQNELLSNATGSAYFWTPDSIMPGDTVTLGSAYSSLNNSQGSYTVLDQGATDGDIELDATFTAVGATTLTSALITGFSVKENSFSVVQKVAAVIPDVTTPTRLNVVLEPSGAVDQVARISPVLGGTMLVLDKLEFGNDLVTGADGYAVATGLIQEVVKVLYGDPNAPTTYPGYVAAGATVYVAGPNLKRIAISLQLRLRSGVPQSTIVDRVRASIVAEVNQIPLGTAVDISRIIAAARRVQGVVSVAVLSPDYSSTNDVITVQSNEKPFILNPAEDIGIDIVS